MKSFPSRGRIESVRIMVRFHEFEAIIEEYAMRFGDWWKCIALTADIMGN